MARSSASPSPAGPAARRASIKTELLCALGLLALATLACAGGGTNVQATVNAVDTAVQLTLVGMAPTGGAGTSVATSTPLAPPASTAGPGTATPSASATLFVPPTSTARSAATATPGASTPIPGSDQPLRPNGPLIHAVHRASAPVIDAQGNDWPGTLPDAIDQVVFKAAGFNGPFNQGSRFAMGWDANNLYLYVVVQDSVHVQTQHGENLFRGDSLELQFDADLAGDFADTRLSPDDYQLGLSPGDNRTTPEAYLWNPAGRAGVPSGINMASRAGSDAGYIFEAAIPWSFFGVSPTAGQHFGMALNVSDDDAPGTAIQQSMLSSVSTRQLLDPTSWGTLQLDP